MKKYFVYFDDLCDERPAPTPGFQDHEVYLASEVEARIGTLMMVISLLRAGHKAEDISDVIKREIGLPDSASGDRNG